MIDSNKLEHDVIQKPVSTFWHHALNKRDRRHEAAVIGLPAMGGAAVRIEPYLVGIGVEREILETADPGAADPVADEARQVEEVMIGPRRIREEGRKSRVGRQNRALNSGPTS